MLDWREWLVALNRGSTLLELAVLAGCLLAAYAVVWLWRGKRRPAGSVWFGQRVFDGVLFPVLALLAAWGARYALPSGVPPAVLKLAVPVLGSLALIRVSARVLRQAFPASAAVRSLERSFSWLVWGALVLWLTGLLPRLLAEMDDVHWRLGGADLSLRTMVEGVLSALAVMLLMLWLAAAIESALLKGATANLSVRKIAANAARASLLLVGLMMALSAAGIPLSALSVVAGAVGVGIGFGLQKLASNYVSGFVILAERSIRIGDTIKVDGFEGKVTDIKTRYTVIRAVSGREAIIPNEMLITQRVENSSLADSKVAFTTKVQVAYGTELAALMPALASAVAGVPRVLAEPAPAVQLTAFAADGLELTVPFWISDPENGLNNVMSDVNLALLAALQAAGVEIPFPQRVVHQLARPAADSVAEPQGAVAAMPNAASG